jgi:hypothetical protein
MKSLFGTPVAGGIVPTIRVARTTGTTLTIAGSLVARR